MPRSQKRKNPDTVKTITHEVLWMTRCTVARGRRPRATVHRVIHSTEGVIDLTVAQKESLDAKEVVKDVISNGSKTAKHDSVNSDEPEGVITHWLMKSEPESRFENGVDVKFGIEDLKACDDQTACWDGVRNYQARNFMMKGMKLGHKVFFYHSNTKEPGIAGVCQIVKESYVDHTQFDSKDPHYDLKSSKEKPKWFMVDVKYERMMKRYIPLSELKKLHLKHKENGGPLRNIALFTKARLSVQPVSTEEWDFIMSLENE